MSTVASGITASVVPAFAVGGAAALANITYVPLRHLITVIHEAGHAVLALLCGRSVRAVRLHRDSSGETVSLGGARGPGVVLTLVAGYPAPSVVGAAGVWAVVHAQARLWVLVLAAILCGVLLVLRNAFGFLVLAACVAVMFALTRAEATMFAAPAVMAISAFLLVGGTRGCLELLVRPSVGDDPSALARVTGLVAGVWRVAFVVASGVLLGISVTAVFTGVQELSPG